MKIPPKSKAAKKLAHLSSAVKSERLRCAKAAYSVGEFCFAHYKDEPAQWILCEEIFKAILGDGTARFDFMNKPTPPSVPERGREGA